MRILGRESGPGGAWMLVAAIAAAAGPARGATFPLDLYAQLLTRHTRSVEDTAGTRVDYRALARSEDWQRLVAGLAAVDPASLATRAEKLAFWINAYNVLAIDIVVDHYPVESIRDIGSLFSPVWKREAGRIGGRAVTLHEIEHQILRPMGDPRIHAAIVCASTSCPSLLREPFRAEDIEAQLDGAVRDFLASPRKGLRIDRAEQTVHLSSIFDWFEEDFAPGGGVLAFVARYATDEQRAWLARHADGARVEHMDYDWDLNDLAT